MAIWRRRQGLETCLEPSVRYFSFFSFLFYFTNYYTQINYEYLHHNNHNHNHNCYHHHYHNASARSKWQQQQGVLSPRHPTTTTGARDTSRADGTYIYIIFSFFTLLITIYRLRIPTPPITTYDECLLRGGGGRQRGQEKETNLGRVRDAALRMLFSPLSTFFKYY